MAEYDRRCPYCGNSSEYRITNEMHDIYGTTIHIMLNITCDVCGKEFVAEDDYELVNSATGKDPDDLYNNLCEDE